MSPITIYWDIVSSVLLFLFSPHAANIQQNCECPDSAAILSEFPVKSSPEFRYFSPDYHVRRSRAFGSPRDGPEKDDRYGLDYSPLGVAVQNSPQLIEDSSRLTFGYDYSRTGVSSRRFRVNEHDDSIRPAYRADTRNTSYGARTKYGKFRNHTGSRLPRLGDHLSRGGSRDYEGYARRLGYSSAREEAYQRRRPQKYGQCNCTADRGQPGGTSADIPNSVFVASTTPSSPQTSFTLVLPTGPTSGQSLNPTKPATTAQNNGAPSGLPTGQPEFTNIGPSDLPASGTQSSQAPGSFTIPSLSPDFTTAATSITTDAPTGPSAGQSSSRTTGPPDQSAGQSVSSSVDMIAATFDGSSNATAGPQTDQATVQPFPSTDVTVQSSAYSTSLPGESSSDTQSPNSSAPSSTDQSTVTVVSRGTTSGLNTDGSVGVTGITSDPLFTVTAADQSSTQTDGATLSSSDFPSGVTAAVSNSSSNRKTDAQLDQPTSQAPVSPSDQQPMDMVQFSASSTSLAADPSPGSPADQSPNSSATVSADPPTSTTNPGDTSFSVSTDGSVGVTGTDLLATTTANQSSNLPNGSLPGQLIGTDSGQASAENSRQPTSLPASQQTTTESFGDVTNASTGVSGQPDSTAADIDSLTSTKTTNITDPHVPDFTSKQTSALRSIENPSTTSTTTGAASAGSLDSVDGSSSVSSAATGTTLEGKTGLSSTS